MKKIEYYNSRVATNVKEVIREKGLKQSAVALKAGFSVQELNDMLNGRKIIKAVDIEKLAIILGVDANRILGIKVKEVV